MPLFRGVALEKRILSLKKKLGLIAGRGIFPLLLAEKAKAQSYTVYAIAIKEETSPDIEKYVDKCQWIHVGQLQKVILFFKWNRVKNLVMAGKVMKTQIYDNTPMDFAFKDVLKKSTDRKDDSLLKGVVDKVESYGFRFMDSTFFLKDQMASSGAMTILSPSEEELVDIDFGLEMAKAISGLDIGQTVVVKDKAVIAVEAIEGTSAAIERAAGLAGEGIVVVKVSKPLQDMRFDVPVVGSETLLLLNKCGAKVLAVETGKTLLLNKEVLIAKANELELVLYGIEHKNI